MKKVMVLCVISLFFLINNPEVNGETEIKPHVLNDTAWSINIAPDSGGEAFTDKILFNNKKFTTENFSNKEFSPTNYTISMKGQSTVFETMQSKEDETIFVRGELSDENSLRGIYSHRTKKGKTDKVENFSFNGKMTSGILVREGEEKPAPVPEAATPEPQEPQEIGETSEETQEGPAQETSAEAEKTTEEESETPAKKHWWK